MWKAAMDLAVECYTATRLLPASEAYGITSQMRRASASVAANIAEGHGREGTGQFVQFLRVAQGSLKELETHIILAHRVGFLQETTAKPLMERCDEVGRMLRFLIRTLQDKQ